MIRDSDILSFAELEILLEDIEKPGRYTDGEIGVKSKSLKAVIDDRYMVNTALVFPEIYEVGMSNLGLQILYKEINNLQGFNAERVFSPWLDLEKRLRQTSTRLFSLENRIFLDAFDLIGISAQHELLYTNILNVLDLSGIDLHSDRRESLFPLVCLGGSAMVNPVPMSRFYDFAVIGEGEELIIDILNIIKDHKRLIIDEGGDEKISKQGLLDRLSRLDGVYVPKDHVFVYDDDGRLEKIESKKKVKKAYIKDFSKKKILDDPVIANIRPVHDRFVAEIMRGCPRGCRFCQAGFIYRPVRKKNLEKLVQDSIKGVLNTGFDEISFMSLSTTDYTEIEKLLEGFSENIGRERNVSISLPSLRVDDFSLRIAELMQKGRKTGLTFAPEAGSQTLRDIIGKDIDEGEMLDCIEEALSKGWDRLKLYFIIGFSFESERDIDSIVDLVYKIRDLAKKTLSKRKFRRFKLNVSVNAFIPKPFTPFQWLPYDPGGRLSGFFDLLKEKLPKRFVKLSWSDPERSMIESVLSRGDSRICSVIEAAFNAGARFDNWSDIFDFGKYSDAFAEKGLDMSQYTRGYETSETLPWDMIDIGVSKDMLIKQYKKAESLSVKREGSDGR